MVWYISSVQCLLLTVKKLMSSGAIDYDFTSAITYQVTIQVVKKKNTGRSRGTQHMQNVTVQSFRRETSSTLLLNTYIV